MHPSSSQFRAARALLGWSQIDAAAQAKMAVNTIRNLEAGNKSLSDRTQEDLRRTFEAAGIAFMDDGATEGVSLRRGKGRE